MQQALDFISAYSAYFLLGLSVLGLVLLIYTIVLSSKLARISRRRRADLSGDTAEEVLNCLTEQSESIIALQRASDETSSAVAKHGEALMDCVQKVGLVRFNAFNDIGGEQSFALVLLDANRNGVAISSLYGRQDSRLYAKGIINGEGERPLSDEERRAMEAALSGRGSTATGRTPAGR